MKQKGNEKEFFEKFGFTSTRTKPHPKFKEHAMEFTGLEADYVSGIESEIEFWKEAYDRLRAKLDWMTTQEMNRLRDVIEKSK